MRNQIYRTENLRFVESTSAWGIYRGILMNAGYEGRIQPVYEKAVLDAATLRPAVGKEVMLDDALVSVTDDDGIVRFFDVEGSGGNAQVLDEGRYEILDRSP